MQRGAPEAYAYRAEMRKVACVSLRDRCTVAHMTTTDTRPGALLARRRWDRPEHVAKRVERLAAEIAKLPPLTRDQRAQLASAIKAAA
jgi:hypothetical protein